MFWPSARFWSNGWSGCWTRRRTHPDKDDPQLIHHLAVVPEHGNRVLRVVFNHLVTPVRVVTVYFDRKMKGKL